jgi:hypothetical protein
VCEKKALVNGEEKTISQGLSPASPTFILELKTPPPGTKHLQKLKKKNRGGRGNPAGA